MLPGPDRSGTTAVGITLGPAATVVVVAAPRLARVGRLPTTAEGVAALVADQQPLQQVPDTREALPVAAAVLGQLLPRALEQPLIDDRRDRDGDPALGRRRDLARRAFRHPGAAARRAQRRPPRHGGVLAEDGPAGVGGVRQPGPDHAAAPAGVAGRAGHPGVGEPAADRRQGDALDADPAEDPAYHLGLVLDHLEAGDAVPGV